MTTPTPVTELGYTEALRELEEILARLEHDEPDVDRVADDVARAIRMLSDIRVPAGLVENMSFFMDSAGVKHEIFGSGGGQKVAEYAQAPLLGQIPMDTEVREWGDKGTPVVQSAPESSAGLAFAAVADELSTHVAKIHFDRSGGDKAPATEGRKRLKILR